MNKSDMKGAVSMKSLSLAIVAAAIAASALAPSYARAEGSRLSIGLGQGVADGYTATTVGSASYLAPTSTPEINVGAEYWHSMSKDYALAISGAYGFSNMKWEGAATGDPEVKATGTSFKFRLGGDRTGRIGERLTVFIGPGLEFWSGKQKVTVGGAGNESNSVKRFGVSGRIGGFMELSEKVALMGQVGHTFGYATVSDGAKSTWFPSGFNASWGLTFNL